MIDWIEVYAVSAIFGHVTVATVSLMWSVWKFWSFPGGPVWFNYQWRIFLRRLTNGIRCWFYVKIIYIEDPSYHSLCLVINLLLWTSCIRFGIFPYPIFKEGEGWFMINDMQRRQIVRQLCPRLLIQFIGFFLSVQQMCPMVSVEYSMSIKRSWIIRFFWSVWFSSCLYIMIRKRVEVTIYRFFFYRYNIFKGTQGSFSRLPRCLETITTPVKEKQGEKTSKSNHVQRW